MNLIRLERQFESTFEEKGSVAHVVDGLALSSEKMVRLHGQSSRMSGIMDIGPKAGSA